MSRIPIYGENGRKSRFYLYVSYSKISKTIRQLEFGSDLSLVFRRNLQNTTIEIVIWSRALDFAIYLARALDQALVRASTLTLDLDRVLD